MSDPRLKQAGAVIREAEARVQVIMGKAIAEGEEIMRRAREEHDRILLEAYYPEVLRDVSPNQE